MSRYWPLLVLSTSKFFKVEDSVFSPPRHILKEHHTVPDHWTRVAAADPDHQFSLHIAIKQSNFPGLEKRLFEISDPFHASYGRHLSAEEVNTFVTPSDKTLATIHAWLESNGIGRDQTQHSPAKDWISISNITVSGAQSLLNADYHVYRRNGQEVVRSERWSLPARIHPLIDTIHPTNSFFNIHARDDIEKNSLKRPIESMSGYATDVLDGSAILNGIDVANPPRDLTAEQACNITAITPLCLRILYGTLNYTLKANSKNKMALCNFSGEFNNRTDARTYLKAYRPDASAGADNFEIVEIEGGINRQAPSTQAQLESGEGKEGGLDAQVLLGMGYPTPMVTYTTGGPLPPFASDPSAPVNDNEPFLLFINWLLAQKQLPTVLSISYADTEYTVPPSYAKRVCQGFAQLGARGVSVIFGSGDWGVGNPKQCHDKAGNRKFAARFPDSCPYITSVAATRGVNPQVVGYNENNHFVSGGGFSDYFPRPKYQEKAVSKYLENLGSQHRGLYNAGGRAYPDVAAMGYRIVTIWNGKPKVVDGTSASAPIFAGVVALLNDARMAQGKPPLGFLNPWIYSVGLEGGFVDVVNGRTTGCNTTGFPAREGWDAASGFGTPWFPKLEQLATQDRVPIPQPRPWYIPVSREMLHQMAATFQYAKQYSWSKIRHARQQEFRPVPSCDEDERGSREGLLEKGPSGALREGERSLWREPTFLIFQGALLSLYLLVLALVAASKAPSCRGEHGAPYSPATNVIEYRDTQFTLEDHIQDLSIYSGAPSPELDKAWHDLLNSQNVRVESKYYKHYGREKIGVAVPGSADYIGTLNVFHELHCIKRLHQFMYPEYYFPDFTKHQLEMNRLHNEHCLDFLRQSAMCHGDIGLITYIWREDSIQPVVNATSHQCINWDKLYGWSQDRAVDMLKPGWLMHPTKGTVYPEGEGDRIGAIDKELHH
ncbi:hypothetical protein PWT90_04172 [Aphanocladium album]|nr:hypothetical protein PWT90_04172 [Aphanocladium album]